MNDADRREIIRAMLTKRYHGAVPVTGAMIDAVLGGLAGDADHAAYQMTPAEFNARDAARAAREMAAQRDEIREAQAAGYAADDAAADPGKASPS